MGIEMHIMAFTPDGDESFEKYFELPVVPRVGEEIWIHDKYFVSGGADAVLEVVTITSVVYRYDETEDAFSVLLEGLHTGCV